MSEPQRVVRYAYLNREPAWSGFDLSGLEVLPDGTLVLARVPAASGTVGTPAVAPPTPSHDPTAGPAGVAVCRGDVFAADPAAHRIGHFNECLDFPKSIPCAAGPGPWPGQLDTPRGLAALTGRAGVVLVVAEEGNHRIQAFDAATGQVLFVVGETGPDGLPLPGDGPGEFRGPRGLAADAAGNLYVADRGNGRVQKLGPRGAPDAGFGERVKGLNAPEAVAVGAPPPGEDGPSIYVLDIDAAGAGTVLIYDGAGNPRAPGSFAVTEVATPAALAVGDGPVFVGSYDGSLARYDTAGKSAGKSAATEQSPPVRGLAVGPSGALLATPGGWPLTLFLPTAGCVTSGHFRTGPIVVNVPPFAWHRWRVDAEGAAGVALFTRVRPAGSPDPGPGTADDPFPPSEGWQGLPRGQLDVLVLDDDVRAALAGALPPGGDDLDPDGPPRDVWVWLAGRLDGDGTASPAVHQMRLDVAPGSSLRHLPGIYRSGTLIAPVPNAPDTALAAARRAALQSRLLLDLWLAALDAALGRTAEALAELPRRFDPAAAPSDGLPWLASWIGFDWDASWPEADARRYLAGGFDLAKGRGTVAGLRAYLKIYAGVDAWVVEPSAGNGGAPLVLGSSALGFDSVLAPAPPFGAVLASTATLAHTHLLDPADGGVPLFADVAARFCVQVHAAQVASAAARAALDAALAREAPGHTAYHVCVVPPRMRVGFQGRLGIDTVVGGPTPDLTLGDGTGDDPGTPATLGVDAVLADRPRRSNRLGAGARVGGVLGP
jgi:phage tail-like protein